MGSDITPKKISIDSLKLSFDEILRRVEMGESFTVVSDTGFEMAIVPSLSDVRNKARVAVSNILNMKTHTVSDKRMIALKEGGRR